MDAEALKAWRQRMSMSQQEAADALSCSLATIQSAETGRRPVAPMMALACEALEMRRQHKGDDDTAGGLDAIRERLAALEEKSPASLEARLNAIEQRLLPEAVLAYAIDCHADWLARQTAPAMPSEAQDLADLRRRVGELERPVRILHQRMAELSAAIEDAGVPLHQKIVPMTEGEAEEADLKLREARLLDLAAKPTPGALTDDERAEAEKARRAIAKARQIAQGEPWE